MNYIITISENEVLYKTMLCCLLLLLYKYIILIHMLNRIISINYANSKSRQLKPKTSFNKNVYKKANYLFVKIIFCTYDTIYICMYDLQ